MIDLMLFQNTKSTPISAYNVAPWIVPAMRADSIYNTEVLKGSKTQNHLEGCPKQLATAIRTGIYDPLKVTQYTLDQLKEICKIVNISFNKGTCKIKFL